MGELGFIRVYNIIGGISVWKRRGLPIVE